MNKTCAHTARIAAAALAALLVAALEVPVAAASGSGIDTQIPTLTNDVGQPDGGAGWQLPLGIGLLVAGLLIALVTFVAYRLHASRNT